MHSIKMKSSLNRTFCHSERNEESLLISFEIPCFARNDNFRYTFLFCFLFLGILISGANITSASDIQATATLQPSEMSVGESTQLSITIEGSASVSVSNLPTIDGLEFIQVGSSTNLRFINGVMNGGVTYVYQVVAQKEGTFTIPPITIVSGGNTIKTNPLTLQVRRSSFVPATPSSSAQVSTPKGRSSTTATNSPSSDVAMIQLIYPKRNFYVGELVPAELKVYLRRGLQIKEVSLPTLSGNAFTVGKLGNNPDQKTELIDGINYAVLTWHTAIAAVKAGEHPLGAQIECIVLVPDSSRRSNPFGGNLFDDPFFDHFFGGVQQKKITLQTQDATVKILPLPTEGRPADFSGAIGHFQISSLLSTKEVSVGDPITLNLKIFGTGNFDRVQAPNLDKNQSFKTYTPSSKFEPTNEAGFVGQKIFEQVLVPLRADVKEVPLLRFSFFDPENHQYVTLTSDPLPIQVVGISPGTQMKALDTMGNKAPFQNSTHQAKETSTGTAELIPNKLDLSSTLFGRTIFTSSPVFWSVYSLPAIALMMVWLVNRRRDHLTKNPHLARTISANRTIRHQLSEMDSALKAGNSRAFFAAARKALQIRLSERSGVTPESITLSEVEDHLDNRVIQEDVRKIFGEADSLAYAGYQTNHTDLDEWKKKMIDALRELEK